LFAASFAAQDGDEMKKTLLCAVAAIAMSLSGPAMADVLFGTFNLEYSEAFGTGQFGTVTITGDTTKALVTVNVGDSWLIDTGGPHQPFAFNLVDGGVDPVVTNVQLDTLFGAGGSNGASPFGTFTNTIVSLPPPLGCDNGGSNGGCGVHELSFNILNYAGFFSNDWKSPDGSIKEIYYAADILYCPTDSCTGGTGNVGGGTVSVPGPVVGAGLPGLAAMGMFGLNFWRRRRNGASLPA
jgi:hypothetical protein